MSESAEVSFGCSRQGRILKWMQVSRIFCSELCVIGPEDLSCPNFRGLFGSGNGHCQCARGGGGSWRATGELARNWWYWKCCG